MLCNCEKKEGLTEFKPSELKRYLHLREHPRTIARYIDAGTIHGRRQGWHRLAPACEFNRDFFNRKKK